jgi:hypothetical protein
MPCPHAIASAYSVAPVAARAWSRAAAPAAALIALKTNPHVEKVVAPTTAVPPTGPTMKPTEVAMSVTAKPMP